MAQPDTLELLFVGDIMGHDSQIRAAFDPESRTYSYSSVFKHIAAEIQHADYAIGNLEVTLAGPPYKGYPLFSSPDELASDLKKHGFDVLVTANNHAVDRGRKGLFRTIRVLDSLNILHTGTFADSASYRKENLLVMQFGDIRVGLLNYTYGVNTSPVPDNCIINFIDADAIKNDLTKAKEKQLDKIILYLHWGNEYATTPTPEQVSLADELFQSGADVIIGAHPHVVQPIAYFYPTEVSNERLIAFSLGNFISNQRVGPRSGGAVLKIKFVKENDLTRIVSAQYDYIWMHKPIRNGKTMFELISSSQDSLIEREHTLYNDFKMGINAAMTGNKDLISSGMNTYPMPLSLPAPLLPVRRQNLFRLTEN